MDALYGLRRVGSSKDLEANASQELSQALLEASQGDEAPEGALLHQTLKDVADTDMQLDEVEDLLAHGTTTAGEFGGARHATAVLCSRTLAVVRRKRLLLHAVEERIKAFEETHSQRDEVLVKLVADEISPPPSLAAIRKFISSYTHKPEESPADANKSNFASFVSSFKLPGKHRLLLRLRAIADEAGEWWAEACLAEANKGAGHAVLRRLFDVALGTGVDKDHPKLIRAMRILTDRLADRVLKEAKERLERDAANASKCTGVPPVGPASAAGDKIEQDVRQAISEGVPQADTRMKEALAICKRLREIDGDRKRLANREKRLNEQKQKES